MLSPMLKQRFEPYLDIVLFVVALLLADAIWKLCVSGDESLNTVAILGCDATKAFAAVSQLVAQQVYDLLSLFRDTVHLQGSHLYFDSGNGTRIVWSCTPIKQSWIWLFIMLVARGEQGHKLWFIAAGWLLIYGINILRVAAVNLIVEFHPDLFQLFHTYLLKYAFYGCMFLMWLVWTTCFKVNKSSDI